MAKQKTLEGFVAVEDKEIAEAVEAYVEIRDKRMKLTEKEVVSNQALVEVMRKHKRKAVSINGCTVELLTGKDKCRVKSAASEKPDEGKEE